jgi:uncharacterized RDD family membrane protein YckC
MYSRSPLDPPFPRSPGGPFPVADAFLTDGVLTRRVVAWLIDAGIIAVLTAVLWVALVLFGIFTLGLGLPLLGLLPAVPVIYGWAAIASPLSATPGQALFGLRVCRDADLGPPGPSRALATVILFYATWAASFLVQVLSLVPLTPRQRMLHDILSGTGVVRSEALTAGVPGWNMRAGGWPNA